MKQEMNKKSKKWIWLTAALALLLVVGTILAILLLGGWQTGADTSNWDGKLYWNVDRESFVEEETGMSAREKEEDGLYHVVLAVDGQQIEYTCADKQLINYLDTMDVVGLVLDADGSIIDVLDPKTVANEVGRGLFVQKIDGDTITVNSSQAMNGMEIELSITANTGIYCVDPAAAEMVGQADACEIMDQVLVYGDAEDNVTHIYITKCPVAAEIYWRVERMYDAESSRTTREPDENGVYTIQFAHKGELVDLKTRDVAVVNNIDAHSLLQGQFAFLFDEEGYIIDNVDIGLALRGVYMASDYHVTAIDGDTYTVTKLSGNDQGKVQTFTLAENCEIFQCCQFGCYDHNCGEYTDHLNLYDRVNVYSNLDGEAIMIFVTRRMVGGDVKLYYNCERKYGGDAIGTTRTKENGYYVFEMMVDGKVTTVRVKDKEMADAIDLPYNRSIGLELDGNIVTKVHNPSCVVGGPNYANETPVTMISGPLVTFTYSNGTTRNFVISADCKIYNAITGEYGKKIGGEIDLQLGDYVIAFTDYKDELAVIYVVTRPVEGGKVYYNLERKYNTKLGETTREPDAEDYYVFLMACEGKQVTVKTKDKGMATFIDSQSAPLAGLKVNKNGIITNAYTVATVLQNATKTCNYHYVRDLNTKAGTFGTYYVIDGVRTDPDAVQQIAKNCEIYNVSTAVENFRGEKSTLQNGDQIQAIKDLTTGEITMIFIMQRDPTYGFESYDAHCDHCNKTVTWAPYSGTIAAADGHYYACGNFAVKQCTVGKDDDGKTFDVVVDLKGHSITSAGRAFLVYDKLTIMDTVGGGKVAGTTPSGDTATTGSTIMVLSGELNIMGGELTLSENSTVYGKYGGVIYLESDCVVNMSGGSITGGISAGRGGNVYINGGTFNMTGGTISGGSAVAGDNIFIATDGVMNISNATVDGGIFMLGTAKVSLSGKTVISGSGMEVPAGTKISVAGLTSGASVVVSGNGVFTDELTNPKNYLAYFKTAAEGDSITVEGNALSYYKVPADYNSVDNSNLVFETGTTKAYCPVCEETVTWIALTDEKAMTLAGGSHYYLASDLTFAGDAKTWFLTGPATGTKACLHLNGNDLTCTNNRAVHGSGGTLNIMGNGTVTGGYTTGGYIQGATVGINTNVATGLINLIGGTYVSTAANTPVVSITDNGGQISMYNGASIRGTADSNAVHIGKASLVNAAFNMFGGTIEGGMISMTGADEAAGNTASLLLGGGTVTSGVQVSNYCDVTVEGSPKIDSLIIKIGVTIKVGALNTDADITVLADGVFTEVLTNAESIKKCFNPAKVNDEIQVVDNALCYVKVQKDLNTVDNSKLNFTSGTKAACPVCGVEVTWTALSDSAITLQGDGHYYLADDVTYTGADAAYITAPGSGKTACVHLNGYNITATAHRAIEGNTSTLNIMGEGIVSGSYNDNRLFGATVNAAGADGAVNLIGGTYTKSEACNVSSIVLIRGGDVNMYAGATITGANGSGTVTNVQVYNNAFNMYGGKISGGAGAQIQTNNWNATATGIVRIYGGEISGNVMINGAADRKHGTFVMENGKLTGYLYLGKGTDATISGGTINATVAVGSGTTNEVSSLTLSGSPVIIGSGLIVPEGYKLTLGELTTDASIKLTANGVFTLANDSAEEYISCFVPNEGFEVVTEDNALLYRQKDTGGDPEEPEGELGLDANGYADCPVCNERVQWTCLNNTTDGRIGFENDSTNVGAHYHYYLSNDLNCTSNALFAERYFNTTCLHLNGHTLQFKAKMNIGIGATLNIMGTGDVIGSCDSTEPAYNEAVLYAYRTGVINLYGGNYSNTNAEAPTILVATDADSQVNIGEGVTVSGGIKATRGTVALSGNAEISTAQDQDIIYIDTDGKLQIAADWSGSAVVSFKEPFVDNMVPEKNGVCDGLFSGSLNTEQGDVIIGSAEGRLLINSEPYEGEAEIKEAAVIAQKANAMNFANAPSTCPVCGDGVTWTAITSADKDINMANGSHYYLSESFTVTSTDTTAYITGVGCLHLNNKQLTVTNTRAIMGSAGTLNIMGTGSVSGYIQTSSGAAVHVNAKNAGATVNLYGGTYSYYGQDGRSSIIYVGDNGGTINMYNGVTVNAAGKSNQYNTPGVAVLGNIVTTGNGGKAMFNMYGGTVTGGTVNANRYNGGSMTVGFSNSTVNGNAECNIYSGTIQNGITGYSGGNVTVGANGSFNMFNGTITGGVANCTVSGATGDGNGGNLALMHTSAAANITGGTITRGSARDNGGNIYVSGGTLRIGDAVLSEGAASNGSNIYLGSSAARLDLGTCQISGDVVVSSASTTVALSGAPVITMGNACGLQSAAMLTLGELTGGSVYISNTGAFALANDKAPDYATYFVCGDDYEITVPENILTVTQK